MVFASGGRFGFSVILALVLAMVSSASAATRTYVGAGGVIPDGGTASSSITVPDVFYISDVTVRIEGLQYDACGQLQATLFNSSLGIAVRLFREPGGFGDRSVFDGTYTFNNNAVGDLDQVAADLGDGEILPSGSYFPDQEGLLDGVGAFGFGTWTLQIEDTAPGFDGSFVQWAIEFEAGAFPTPIVHVDEDGPVDGDGSSWETAYRDLRTALIVAEATGGVAQIRIAEGTYRPSLRDDYREPKTANFALVDGTTIRGGYAGRGAPDPDAWDPELYVTVLSGDQLDNDVPGSPPTDPSRLDNAAHVLVGTGRGPTAVIEGVTVTAGYTFGGGGSEIPRSGAGLLNAPGSPTVRFCRFTENWARVGGAGIFNFGGSEPLIEDCRFDQNFVGATSGGSGAAIRNDSSSPFIRNCVFESNTAESGGAITNITGASPTIEACTFVGNSVEFGGGAIYNQGDSSPGILWSTFDGNTAGQGGAIQSDQSSFPFIIGSDFQGNQATNGSGGAVAGRYTSIEDSTFTGNSASRDGGAVSHVTDGSTILRSQFIDNVAVDFGGGVHVDADGTIEDCLFRGNQAEQGGGAFVERSEAVIKSSTFESNTAERGGGLVNEDDSVVVVVNSAFVGNTATERGGGGYDRDSQVTWINCLFSGNVSTAEGGGLTVIAGGTSNITGGTFSLNRSQSRGGGLAVLASAVVDVSNSVLWGNVDEDPGTDPETEQVFIEFSTFSVSSSTLEGLTGALGGAANLGSDPLFVDADGADDVPGTADDDARLQVGSPSQNSGDPTAVPADALDLDGDGDLAEGIPFDLDGLDRVFDFVVDRGAYETQQTTGGGEGVWVGPDGGDWDEATNWQSGSVPGAETNVVLPVAVVLGTPGAVAASVTIVDGGGLTIAGGSLVTPALTVEAGGSLGLSDPAARLDVGDLALSATGTLDWIAGTIALTPGGTWTTPQALEIGCAGEATLDLGIGGSLTAPSLRICGQGALLGSGDLAGDLVNEGTLVPGPSAGGGSPIGTLAIAGAFSQSSSGSLVMEMTDYSTSAVVDRLDVAGAASLDGSFDLTVLDPASAALMVRSVIVSPVVTGDFPVVTQTDPGGALIAGHFATATAYRVGVSVTGSRLFVDTDVATGGLGQDWAGAMKDLQLALVTAGLSNGAVTEIWVAEGSYLPAEADLPGDPRTAGFDLVEGVTLYGGFSGDEANLEERDPAANPTILTGDRLGDDAIGFQNFEDNLYNVLRGASLRDSAIVDGFTIRGGNGDFGSAMTLTASEVIVRDSTFTSNRTLGGGAVWAASSTLEMIRCEFVANRSESEGGAIFLEGGQLDFVDGVLTNNRAVGFGAGAYLRSGAIARFRDSSLTLNISFDLGGAVAAIEGSHVSIRGGLLQGNRADIEGGGLHLLNASADLVGCDFFANVTGIRGGAIHAEESSSVRAANVRFRRNRSSSRGGGVVHRFGATGTYVNCIFTGNYADRAGGAVLSQSSSATLLGCSVVENEARLEGGGGVWNESGSDSIVANSILWGNSAFEGTVDEEAQIGGSGSVAIDFSCVQGWNAGKEGGSGNFGSDPRFVDADGADDVPGTADDDLRLFVGSPCIDRGDNARVPLDELDADGDGDVSETIPVDVDGLGRFVDDPITPDGGVGAPAVVDLGAHEFQPTCPDCPGIRVWIAAEGGGFDGADNWFPDLPAEIDPVLFDLNAAYAVSFPSSVTSDQVLVAGGEVTFDLGISEYLLTAEDDAGLVVGVYPGSTARLVLLSGSIAGGDVRVGAQEGAFGTLQLAGPGQRLDLTGAVIVGDAGAGEIVLLDAAEATVDGGLVIGPAGGWRGGGTLVGDVSSAGDVEPGVGGAGELVIEGDYVQITDEDGDDDGRLVIELGGSAPGTGHDRLVVSGSATLGGVLSVSLLDGFVPAAGDTFEVLTATSIVGDFEIAFLPTLPDGLVMTESIVTDGPAARVVLTVEELAPSVFTFDDAVLVGGFGTPSAALAEDLTGDGFADVALLVPAPDDNDPGSLLIFTNLGVDEQGGWLGFDPSFRVVVVDREPRSIATGHFNDDPHVDLVVGNFLGPTVSILFNDAGGSGDFTIAQTIVEDQGAGIFGVATGRLYGGTRDDIVFARNDGAHRQRFHVNDGTGNFTFDTQIFNAGVRIPKLATADLNLDGDIEVVQVDFGNEAGQFSSLSISARTEAVPGWESTYQEFYDGGSADFTIIDFDGDRYPDLGLVNAITGTMQVYPNPGDGSTTFGAPIDFATGAAPSSIRSVDLDGDGSPDIALVAEDESGQRVIQLKRNEGTESGAVDFADASPLLTGGPARFVLAADIDGDGSPDLVGVNADTSGGFGPGGGGTLGVLINRTGGAAPPCPADVNGDGVVSFPDLIIVLTDWGPCPGCPADVDGNGSVEFGDLLAVLGAWGACPG